MFEYNKDSYNAAKELDKHDLTDILEQCWKIKWIEPWDIRQKIMSESMPNNENLYYAINELTDDEIIEYLEQRYNIRFKEEIHYCMIKPSFIKN